jgi:toxin CptA
MSHSVYSSSASAPCRIDWRPSRWLAGALVAIGILAALSVLESEIPRIPAWPIAVLAILDGFHLSRVSLRSLPRTLVWPIGGAPLLDGMTLYEPQLHWRGPMAFLRWRDEAGRMRRLAWWPDTLPSAARRELRVAAAEAIPASSGASMAP